jgi:predicted  nucleic acid-binding Zn-ribbon protein
MMQASLVHLQVLREDLEAAQAEAALAQEMDTLLQSELQDLRAQHDEAQLDASAVLEEHRRRLLPKIQQLQEVRAAALPLQAVHGRLAAGLDLSDTCCVPAWR